MNRRSAVFAAVAAIGLQRNAHAANDPFAAQGGVRAAHLLDDAFIAEDGARLPMTVWSATDASGEAAEPWAVIVALHGMNDYAAAFVLAGPYWAKRGITTYAYDQRGFGRGANRGLWPGEQRLVADLRLACALVRARHPKAVLGIVGESMGGAVAAVALASHDPPPADRAVLLSPAVWGWSAQPLENRVALWLAAHLEPAARLTPPAWVARRHQASDNIDILLKMGRDRNMIFATRVDATYGLVNLMQDASGDVGKIEIPTLYAYGRHDALIPQAAAFRAAATLRAPYGRSAYYPDGWHLLNRDLHADVVLEDTTSFLRDPQSPLPSKAPKIPGASV